jgi:hypothetical protein
MRGMSKKSVKPGSEAATDEGEAADEASAAATDDVPPTPSREPARSAAPAPQQASIGRIVHYTSAGEKGFVGQVFAALITGVDAETVALRVFTPTTDFVVPAVRFTDAEAGSVGPDDGGAQGRWSWPRRV